MFIESTFAEGSFGFVDESETLKSPVAPPLYPHGHHCVCRGGCDFCRSGVLARLLDANWRFQQGARHGCDGQGKVELSVTSVTRKIDSDAPARRKRFHQEYTLGSNEQHSVQTLRLRALGSEQRKPRSGAQIEALNPLPQCFASFFGVSRVKQDGFLRGPGSTPSLPG